METIAAWVIGMLQDYPAFSVFLMVMGILRAVNKPLFALINALVGATETKKDDEVWAEAQTSKAMEVFLFLLDWTASVKIKPKAPDVKANTK